jgi:hypothetical protein
MPRKTFAASGAPEAAERLQEALAKVRRNIYEKHHAQDG